MKKKNYLYVSFFLILMIYLIVRALNVFYIHDEIVSKWSYMIDCNPFPYQGYIDANNHFLNSLLGGFFIRLFKSDYILIVRLASLLSFPLYYWILISFKEFFKQDTAFYFFLIALLLNPLILEFFALARGYAMAWTFMFGALLMLFKLIKLSKEKYFYFLLIFSLLAIYSNLSVLIPISLIIGYALLFIFIKMSPKTWLKVGGSVILGSIPFFYLVCYSFRLQSIGKLYLGSSKNFYATTIENIINLSFQLSGFSAFIISCILGGIMFIHLTKQLIKKKSFFDLSFTFSHLFVFAICVIFLLQCLFKINYPEDRAAAYLYLLALAAIAFAIDTLKNKYVPLFLSTIFLTAFLLQINITKTKVYDYEYINLNLLKHIPEKVKGIPTACGGRQLAVSKVLYRETNEKKFHFFQPSLSEADTLQDYILCLKEDRDNIEQYYNLIAKEEDSRMLLFERKRFLNRNKVESYNNEFSTKDEFLKLIAKQKSKPSFIHCKGYFDYVDLHHAPTIIYVQSDSADNKLNYGSFTPLSAVKRSEDNRLYFDITITMLDFKDAETMSLYIWNKKKQKMSGKIITEIYEIDF